MFTNPCQDTREANLPPTLGVCKMCDSGCVEDIEHLIMSCEAYSQPRLKMLAIVGFDPECRSQSDKLDILLGKSTGNSGVDDSIDIAVKRFLKKAWRARK